MALVIETGSGVAGANSYVSLVDAQAFIDARALSVTLTDGALLGAMDHLNALALKGRKTDDANPLACPRTGLYDAESVLIASDSIPGGMVAAQIWLAYYTLSGSDPSAVGTSTIRSETVDVISVSYAVHNGTSTAIRLINLPNVRNSLRGLIATPGQIDRA